MRVALIESRNQSRLNSYDFKHLHATFARLIPRFLLSQMSLTIKRVFEVDFTLFIAPFIHEQRIQYQVKWSNYNPWLLLHYTWVTCSDSYFNFWHFYCLLTLPYLLKIQLSRPSNSVFDSWRFHLGPFSYSFLLIFSSSYHSEFPYSLRFLSLLISSSLLGALLSH